MLQHLQNNADRCARVHGRLDDTCERLLYYVLVLALQICACSVTQQKSLIAQDKILVSSTSPKAEQQSSRLCACALISMGLVSGAHT